MSINIMIDLETLSSANNAAIVSIGAATFNRPGFKVRMQGKFECRIDPASSQKHGLHISAKTVSWWMQQDRAAISDTFNPQSHVALQDGLVLLSEWMRLISDDEDCLVWGNGASFDNVVLRNAYQACCIRPPWEFRGDRCYRTLKSMAPHIVAPENPIKHSALSDAITQARHAEMLFAEIGASHGR